ncbi:MAG: hypothetical protein IKR85_10085 [Clostridia bacterium]|nr:hypothetical protein [Clostridia bacterium]
MRTKQALRLLLSVFIVLTAAALIISCADIYAQGMRARAQTGDALTPVFTRENAGAALSKLWPLYVLTLILLAACLVRARDIRSRAANARAKAPYVPAGYIRYLRAALYACALALIILGILNGGLNDVYVKARNICTECIGLG